MTPEERDARNEAAFVWKEGDIEILDAGDPSVDEDFEEEASRSEFYQAQLSCELLLDRQNAHRVNFVLPMGGASVVLPTAMASPFSALRWGHLF